MNQDSNSSGFTMMTPTFLAVSSVEGCTLADLTVSGYPAPEYDEGEEEWTGGTSGAFTLQFLTTSGGEEASYKWYDNGTKKGWYDGRGSAIPGGAASVKIDAGKSMWIQGKGLTLVSAGAVKQDALVYKSAASGFTACGNGLPVATTLDKLTVSGYSAPEYDEGEEEWTGGTSGAFTLQFLTTSGGEEASYKWYDNGTKKGWYDGRGSAIPGGAASVNVAAGKGFWVQGKGLTLTIPAVFPEKEAAE